MAKNIEEERKKKKKQKKQSVEDTMKP